MQNVDVVQVSAQVAEKKAFWGDFLFRALSPRFFAIVVLFVLLGAGVGRMLPDKYSTYAVIQTGFSDGPAYTLSEMTQFLRSIDLVKPRAAACGIHMDDIALQRYLGWDVSATEIKDTSMIRLTVQYDDPVAVQKLTAQLTDMLIGMGNEKLNRFRDVTRERLANMSEQRKSMYASLDKAWLVRSGTASKLSGVADFPVLTLLLQNSLPGMNAQITSLINSEADLKMALAKSEDFRLISSPALPMKRWRFLTLFVLLGVAAGLLDAWFAFGRSRSV